jgi:metal-sulfur cluster biosynthetic enzyme
MTGTSTTSTATGLGTDEILAALANAVDPCSVAAGRPMNIVEMGLVEKVDIDDGGQVTISLSLTSPSCMMLGQIMDQIDENVAPLLGGERPKMTFDDGLNWTPDRITGAAREHREQRQQVLLTLSRTRA